MGWPIFLLSRLNAQSVHFALSLLLEDVLDGIRVFLGFSLVFIFSDLIEEVEVLEVLLSLVLLFLRLGLNRERREGLFECFLVSHPVLLLKAGWEVLVYIRNGGIDWARVLWRMTHYLWLPSHISTWP